MAKVLTITHSVVGTVDLLAANFKIAQGGFSYQTGDDLIWTTFEIISSLTDALFRAQILGLERMRQYARLYNSDATRNTPVYLNWQSDGESAKRAIVHDLNYESAADTFITANLGRDVALLRLAVQHSPLWEASTAETTATLNDLSTLGGTSYHAVGGYGSMPYRIKELRLSVDQYTYIYNIWIGIRDYRNGYSGFVSKWEAENGINSYDSSDVSDAGASGGYVVRTTFATTTDMARRFSLSWGQVYSTNEDDICGKYLVLARMKLSASTVEVAINLRHGWLGITGAEQSAGITYVSAVTNSNLTNYNLIPLGTVEIPPTGNRDSFISGNTGYMLDYGFALYAERLSATGSMDIDCLVLIPADHLAVINNAHLGTNIGDRVHILTGDDDMPYAVAKLSLTTLANVEYSIENWSVNHPGGLVVVAAQGQTSHDLSSVVDITMDLVPRYLGYRWST